MAAGTALAAMKSASKFGMGNNALAMARAKKEQQETPTNSMANPLGRRQGKAARIKSLESRVEALEGNSSGMEAEAPALAPAETDPITGGFSPGAIDAASGVFGTEQERQASVAPKPQILEEQEESASAQLGGLFADNTSYPGVGL